MAHHKIHLPLGALKVLLAAARAGARTPGQLAAYLVEDGTDIVYLAPDMVAAIPKVRPSQKMGRPRLKSPGWDSDPDTPAKIDTYMSDGLRERALATACNAGVPYSVDFLGSMVVAALQHRLGGPDKYAAAVEMAMDPGNPDLVLPLGPRPPPPHGMTRRPLRQRTPRPITEGDMSVHLPLPVPYAALLRKSAGYVQQGDAPRLAERLLVEALPYVRGVDSSTVLTDMSGLGGMIYDGVTLLLPHALMDRYDELAGQIKVFQSAKRNAKLRNDLMRHAIFTQLARELRARADEPANTSI